MAESSGDYSWIGPLIGAIGGYAASRSGSDETTTTTRLPPELAPLASATAGRGMELGNLPYTPFPYQTTAGFNPYQFAGFDLTANRAMGQNQLLQNAEGSLTDTLGGKYLQGNPWLDAIVDQTQGEIAGKMGAAGFSSGSFGNAGIAEQTAKALADSGNRLRFQNYSQERDRMMQGLHAAPGIYQSGYAPAERLLGMGGTMQQQVQNELGGMYNQFQEANRWPFTTYDAMLAPFGRISGGSTTTAGPKPNTAAGIIGGGLLGGRMFNWNQQGSSQGWGSTPSSYGGYGSDWGTTPQWGESGYVGP